MYGLNHIEAASWVEQIFGELCHWSGSMIEPTTSASSQMMFRLAHSVVSERPWISKSPRMRSLSLLPFIPTTVFGIEGRCAAPLTVTGPNMVSFGVISRRRMRVETRQSKLQEVEVRHPQDKSSRSLPGRRNEGRRTRAKCKTRDDPNNRRKQGMCYFTDLSAQGRPDR